MGLFDKIASFFSSGKSTSKAAKAAEVAKPEFGVVKNFNHSKGFGFINCAAYERNVFLHISDMQHRVRVGQKVKFEVEKTEKAFGREMLNLQTLKFSSKIKANTLVRFRASYTMGSQRAARYF